MKFAQPAWFVLLVLLPLLGVAAVVVARLRRKQWAAFVAPRLRAMLLQSGSPLPRWFALLFLLAACAAILLALARPQGDDGVRIEKSLGRNLLIALDLSRSMRVRDVKPDRLSQAKMVIYELLDAMPNERVGLIGFAGASYVYAPLTVDHAAVRETVEQIDETWVPEGGSNLAAAVRLATETLRKTGQQNNALVILSDGEKHEGNLNAMVDEAEHAGVYILAVGVGTEDGDYVPKADAPGGRLADRSGKPVVSRLQPDVLRKLATQTKGRYAVAGTGLDIPKMVKSVVKDLDAFEVEGRERSVFIEFYQWLVLPAIVFLLGSILAGTRWRTGKAAALAAAVVLTPAAARADAAAAAKDALRHQHYPQARDAYHQLAESARSSDQMARFRLGEGTAAYRTGDFKRARAAFSGALLSGDLQVLAGAHTGMGNTLFQIGWQTLADEPYPADPAQAPDLQQFEDLVKQCLAQIHESPEPADGESSGYARIEAIITNWSDAVRHFDSARAANPPDPAANNNRGITLVYLKRLAGLLDDERQQAEQALPQPQPGAGEAQPGDGDPKEKPDGKEGDDKGPKPPGDKGQDDKNPKDQNGADGDKEKPETKPDDKKEEKDSDQGNPIPDESPEDRARRILKENADLEKGPLTPGRREFQSPKQDW